VKYFNAANVASSATGNNDRLLLQVVRKNGVLCVAVGDTSGFTIEAS
jgi:hypothetical protein